MRPGDGGIEYVLATEAGDGGMGTVVNVFTMSGRPSLPTPPTKMVTRGEPRRRQRRLSWTALGIRMGHTGTGAQRAEILAAVAAMAWTATPPPPADLDGPAVRAVAHAVLPAGRLAAIGVTRLAGGRRLIGLQDRGGGTRRYLLDPAAEAIYRSPPPRRRPPPAGTGAPTTRTHPGVRAQDARPSRANPRSQPGDPPMTRTASHPHADIRLHDTTDQPASPPAEAASQFRVCAGATR